jgi:hypothetical protein
MDAATRLMEEWKANNDLLKFYEDLRQKHLAHFLTIQTAFLAFFAVLAKDALATVSMVSLTALLLIAVPPLLISRYFMRADRHSRAYVEAAATRNLFIETAWKVRSPENHFSIYEQLFALLSRHDEQLIGRYLDIRNMAGDPFKALSKSGLAPIGEHTMFQMFFWLWVNLAGLAGGIHLIWHLVNGFGAMKLA